MLTDAWHARPRKSKTAPELEPVGGLAAAKKKKSKKNDIFQKIKEDMRKSPQNFVGITGNDLVRAYADPEGIASSTFKSWLTGWKKDRLIVEDTTPDGNKTVLRIGRGRLTSVA
jgi:hypothetical protein